jgi:hypothetical protein
VSEPALVHTLNIEEMMMFTKKETEFARAYLKATIKGNAEACRSLRQLARKADGRPICSNCGEPWTIDHTHGAFSWDADENQAASMKCRLKQTAKDRYRAKIRHKLLAYGFLRGLPYKCIEKSCRIKPKPNWIQSYLEEAVLKYDGWRRQVALGDVEQWLKPPVAFKPEFELEAAEVLKPSVSHIRADRSAATLMSQSPE